MKVTLVGVQEVDFEDSKSGDKIEGVKIHFVAPDENVQGHKADSSFIRRNVFNAWSISFDDLVLCIGSLIDVEYGPKGKIVGIDLMEEAV